MDFATYAGDRQRVFEDALRRSLPSPATRPQTIHKAMRYSMFAGGKRLRPLLCLAAAEAVSDAYADALPLACAVECIHTYSLIHDDLPCMDNDDFRRGKPTSHKVFGEAIAILAGDALLTIAFEIAASCKSWPRYSHANVIGELAAAAGSQALVAGQVADIESEGKKITPSQLRFIHERKTAALISSSVRLGGMAGNATPRQLDALTDFGRSLGLAFQIIDDILDITQTTEQLGKSAGKDVKAQKATYPSVLGMDQAQKEAARFTERAHQSLRVLGPRADALRAIADYLLRRKH
jgi:geranylgeranyl diphosphate synthase type II